MAKKKVWRVMEEYDGKVTIENEETKVVLSNKLSAEELEAMAENPVAVGFMEKLPVTPDNNGES